jgi:quercetin dioxygenase-like cupin family protein
MQSLAVQTAIEAGNDKQVDQLFTGPRRKIIQITLRNNSILAAHQAPVPITIQCIAGRGTLKSETVLDLNPGVLVTLEPNEVHEVQAAPDLSILLTQFTGA